MRRVTGFTIVVLLCVLDVPPGASARTTSGGSVSAGPRVIQPSCPSTTGLGLAARAWPALRVGRRFLAAMETRRPDPAHLWALTDPWFHATFSPGDPAALASQLRLVSPLQLGTKVGPGSARWLDVPTERLGPTDNTRFRLLEAGVPAYSCPLRVLHRIILATWWIRASCACPERPWVDLLVVLRSGRYRVFGLS